jgi:hypothetical protein
LPTQDTICPQKKKRGDDFWIMIHTNDLYIKCLYCQNDNMEKLYVQDSYIMQDGEREEGYGVGVQVVFECEKCNKLTEVTFLVKELKGKGDKKKYPINMTGGELPFWRNND